MAVALGCALAFLLANPAHLLRGGTAALEPAVAGIAAVAASLGARSEWIRRSKAAIGARSERRVAREIEHLGCSAVIHGALLGAGGDADHIVVGPALAVIETKTGRGNVAWSDGRLLAGRRAIPGNPVAQVRRQAAALGRRAGVRPMAVVCVPDMEGRPFMVDEVTVCSLASLSAVLRAAPTVLDPSGAERVVAALAQRPELPTPAAPAPSQGRNGAGPTVGHQGRRAMRPPA